MDTQQVTSPHLEATLKKVKDFRKEIDANIQKTEYWLGTKKDMEDDSIAVTIRQAGRELALVRTKLQEAKMWSGKMLEALGSPFPKELADKAE